MCVGVPHHLLGTVSPNVEFTAKEFRDSAIPVSFNPTIPLFEFVCLSQQWFSYVMSTFTLFSSHPYLKNVDENGSKNIEFLSFWYAK